MDKRQETGQAKEKSWPIDRAILNSMETLTRDKRETYQRKSADTGQIYKAKDRA
jgi:hypothetical protein